MSSFEQQQPIRSQSCCEGVNNAISEFYSRLSVVIPFVSNLALLDLFLRFKTQAENAFLDYTKKIIRSNCNQECCGETADAIGNAFGAFISNAADIINNFGDSVLISDLETRLNVLFIQTESQTSQIYQQFARPHSCKHSGQRREKRVYSRPEKICTSQKN